MTVIDKHTPIVPAGSRSGDKKQRFAVVLLILGMLLLVGMLASTGMSFLYAPTDAIQGDAQRIFYLHLPVAWIGMLSFVVLTGAGVCYMVTKREQWDWLARAAAEVGAVFITLALITGSIWGRTTWGTWWTWDPKLTATLILWFMYIGYIMLRNYMGRTPASAYSGAVLAIVGLFDVPIIYLSVQWWRGLHPQAQVGVQGALPMSVTLTVVVALITFTLFYSLLMVLIYQLQRLQARSHQLRAIVE